MAYINVSRVRGKMAEKGYNITSMANVLEIDRNTMASYLNNPEKIPFGVVEQLAALLCDTREEAADIFFASDLRETQDL